MPKLNLTGYAIVTPDGRLMLDMVRRTGRGCRYAFFRWYVGTRQEPNINVDSWADLRKLGYRCARVSVRVIEESKE